MSTQQAEGSFPSVFAIWMQKWLGQSSRSDEHVNTCLMESRFETSRRTAFKNSPPRSLRRVDGKSNLRNTLSNSALAAIVALRSGVGIATRK